MSPSHASANARTEARSARSSAAHLGAALDRGGGLLALGGVADGEHDARAGAAERAGGDEADAAVGAGDDERAVLEAGKVLRGPLRRGHASKVAGDNNAVNDNIESLGSRAMTARARPYHHGNLRSALLSCAERTLSEHGAEQLSLRELARQVGVSHAAPRRHFADKQSLLDALAEDGFERLGRELRAAMEAAGSGFHARLLAFAQTYVRFATAARRAAGADVRRQVPARRRGQPARGGRPRVRGAARADHRGPGRRRGRARRSRAASRPWPGRRSRASPRWSTAACSTTPGWTCWWPTPSTG